MTGSTSASTTRCRVVPSVGELVEVSFEQSDRGAWINNLPGRVAGPSVNTRQ